ncbi:MAG TPA: tripartite tricarboxylate transporter substrate binding protein [Burkholderiales bacterium]|nr:tripartite tricarboxylate transporter substrate binding protein [Burkholderiales bacterium]
MHLVRIMKAVGALLLGCALSAHAAAAEKYPTKPIRIVVPYPPGGGTDMLARAVAEKLTQRLGAQVIVDNRPGAGTNIGIGLVANGTPDGYTLLLASVPLAINPSLYENLPWDPKELEPLTLVASSPLVLVAHPSVKANNIRELIDLAKTSPGKLNFSSIGSGTSSHLSGELLKVMTGIDIVHIPYKGSAPALTALLGAQVQLMFSTMIAGMPHIQSGRLKALGVSSQKRAEVLPKVGAIAETVPGFETIVWYGFLVPAKTPKLLLTKLHTEIAASLTQSDVVQRFKSEGADIIANRPEEFGRFLANERVKWAKVVKQSGAKVD